MQFEDKKLTPEAVSSLFETPISNVKPFTLMLSPVYVFMKRNEKFVSVKAPLDFFTPEDLERLSVYERFFFPKFVKNSVRYQTAAKLIRSLLVPPEGTIKDLGFAPYEISNESLKMIGKLWGREMSIEPFFMAVFTHELCNDFDHSLLLRSREQNVVRHDLGLLLSGAYGFLAVHLGCVDFEVLNQRRNEIYERTVLGETWNNPSHEWECIVRDLLYLIDVKKSIERSDFANLPAEWAKRLCARLERVEKTFAKRAEASPSIYGPEGFAA